ncbi:V-type proton ATPase subunit e 2-like [Oratosquilla oratoria]|uniref:V-type proton ATPase subunit e 2-like n=1 Tax=Oratosquilla oratoria TaxID=337810 RepID=UPI003F766EA4
MGAAAVPVAVVTIFFAVIGGVLPFVIAKGPNKGVIQVVLVITAASCWLFWLCCYMHQMNPLIGPQLHTTSVWAVMKLWDGTEFNVTEDIDTTTMSPEITSTSVH